jgi:5-methyltetrahydrofolate--homocysteine methyltransferase
MTTDNDRMTLYMPMQTFLVEEYGKPMEQHLSEWILDHPKEYQDAARRSFAAGCDMVHTGTQASSRIRAKPFGLEGRVYELNLKSAKLAREVTPEGRFVIGNFTSTNPDFLEPVGSITHDEVYEAYKPQILGLAEGGVDVFHAGGAQMEVSLIILKMAKELTNIPIIAFNTFYSGKKGFRTIDGLDPETAARKLNDIGADVIGGTCGKFGYKEAPELLKQMRMGTDKPLMIQPDAGVAQLIRGETVYPATPDELESILPTWLDAGAWVIGGCCGTNLEHYRKISSVLQERKTKGIR